MTPSICLFIFGILQITYHTLKLNDIQINVEPAEIQPADPIKFKFSTKNIHNKDCFFYNLDYTNVQFYTTDSDNYNNENHYYFITNNGDTLNPNVCLKCKPRMNIYFALHKLLNMPNQESVTFPIPIKTTNNTLFFSTLLYDTSQNTIFCLYLNVYILIILHRRIDYVVYPCIDSKFQDKKIKLGELSGKCYEIHKIKPTGSIEIRKMTFDELFFNYKKTKYCVFTDLLGKFQATMPGVVRYKKAVDISKFIEEKFGKECVKNIDNLDDWEHPAFQIIENRLIDPRTSIKSIPSATLPSGKGVDNVIFPSYNNNLNNIMKYHAKRMDRETILKSYSPKRPLWLAFILTLIICAGLFLINKKAKSI